MLAVRCVGAATCAAAVVACAASAYAEPATAALPTYVELGSQVTYRVVTAPLPARRLGAIAAAQLSGDDLPAVLGDSDAASPARRGAMPLGAKSRDGACRCATQVGDDRRERVAALRVERDFEVGDEVDDVGLLEVRARYLDGAVIRINGREVVRRNIARDAAALSPAERPRGPELETFFIPVTPGTLRRGANRISVEVRPSGHRLSPVLDFELRPRRGARIVRGPVLSRVTDDSALITFETDLPTRAHVAWGHGVGLGARAESVGGALAVRHRVKLTGLPRGKPIHYQAVAGASASSPAVFHPAPAAGAPLRFVVYGDMRGGHDVHRKIVRSILAEAPDFVLVTGDLVMRGSDGGDWQRFFEVAGPLLSKIPYYPVAGNHDVGRAGAEQRRMNEIFALWPGPETRPSWGHWYSFDIGDVHIVMLDSNSYRHDGQLEWLERDLAAARKRGARAIFAATHDGPYSRGIHRGNRYAAERYAPLLARYNVAMVFSGHDHLYQRGEVGGLNYIVSGGGGAPLYPVRCGIPGKRRCRVDDGMKKAISAYHYVAVSVFKDHARVCPRRPDRDPLEPCVTIRFR